MKIIEAEIIEMGKRLRVKFEDKQEFRINTTLLFEFCEDCSDEDGYVNEVPPEDDEEE